MPTNESVTFPWTESIPDQAARDFQRVMDEIRRMRPPMEPIRLVPPDPPPYGFLADADPFGSDGLDAYNDDDTHSDDCSCVQCGGEGGTIFHYGYKPEPVFHGDDSTTCLGMELEIGVASSRRSNAALFVGKQTGPLVYLKEDGSVRGFEMVTHPMTYQWAMTNFPWPLLPALRKRYGAESRDDYGLHVHVCRSTFGASPGARSNPRAKSAGELHMYRWLKFLYRNSAQMALVARRTSDTWASWDPTVGQLAKDISKGGRANTGRGVAVNTLPPHTIEIRAFRSSLTPVRVQAALGLVDASVEYTRRLTAKDVADGGWGWEAFRAYVRNTPKYDPLRQEMERLTPCAS